MTETTSSGPPARMLQIGTSNTAVCGVRDYARVIARGAVAQGIALDTVWWDRPERRSFPVTLREMRSWLADVSRRARDDRPDALLWHYTAFSHAHRGLSTLAPMVAWALRRLDVPVVVLLHEFAHRWRGRAWRGPILAATQRLALLPVLAVSSGAVVMTRQRADWVESRRWLPRRPVLVLPVPANVPVRTGRSLPSEGTLVGVLGFGSGDYVVAPVLEAVDRIRRRSAPVRLLLVGSPGAVSGPADAWRRAAIERGCPDLVEFSGVLSAEDYARAIESLDVVIFPDRHGPASRRTVVAAALAAGRPLVSFAGPETWAALADAGAVVLTPQAADRLEAALAPLVSDPVLRDQQGRRGAAFYRERMAPEVVAGELVAFARALSHPRVRSATNAGRGRRAAGT